MPFSRATTTLSEMAPRTDAPQDPLEWPERWPVLGPLAGIGIALSGTGVAIREGDWFAATIFLTFAAVLGGVAVRNRRVVEGPRWPGTPGG
jgi:hypothetical protein